MLRTAHGWPLTHRSQGMARGSLTHLIVHAMLVWFSTASAHMSKRLLPPLMHIVLQAVCVSKCTLYMYVESSVHSIHTELSTCSFAVALFLLMAHF